jgi:5'-nucleotidase
MPPATREPRLRILLSNDDGIGAPGLQALAEAMRSLGEVWVVAPEQEMSAAGHAITIADPLRVKEIAGAFSKGVRAFAVNGTPADCVKLAVRALMHNALPDIVVSGVNRGANIAHNLIYSGTVSAATEGSILKIPAMAVSLADPARKDVPGRDAEDFIFAARFARRLVPLVLRRGLAPGTLLNVNVPRPPVEGVKITRQGRSVFIETFDRRYDPHGRVYYWQTGAMERPQEDGDTDDHALMSGYISITPIHYDLTHEASVPRLQKWLSRLRPSAGGHGHARRAQGRTKTRKGRRGGRKNAP